MDVVGAVLAVGLGVTVESSAAPHAASVPTSAAMDSLARRVGALAATFRRTLARSS